MVIANLEDLFRELWLRERNEGTLVWKTRDNKIIPIKDMSTNHLINTINYLDKKSELLFMGDFDCNG